MFLQCSMLGVSREFTTLPFLQHSPLDQQFFRIDTNFSTYAVTLISLLKSLKSSQLIIWQMSQVSLFMSNVAALLNSVFPLSVSYFSNTFNWHIITVRGHINWLSILTQPLWSFSPFFGLWQHWSSHTPRRNICRVLGSRAMSPMFWGYKSSNFFHPVLHKLLPLFLFTYNPE